jgi:uroporphyrinogen III methyltransferase/synthase
VAVYRTVAVDQGRSELLDALKTGQVDLVTFTSSSTVKNFKALLPPEGGMGLMGGVTVASIGPITTQTAQELGFTVHMAATRYTIDGLVDAILDHYRGGHGESA